MRERGIAPAMKVNGERTYWGAAVDEDVPDKTKNVLGIDRELQTPGMDAEQTSDREEALEITDGPANANISARRLMLKWKEAHASDKTSISQTSDGLMRT